MSGQGGKKVLLPPINFIFKLLQQRSTVVIWLTEQLGVRIEGKLRGFDEFMNLVIDDAVEVKVSPKEGQVPRRKIGMLLMQALTSWANSPVRTNASQRR